MRLIINSGGPSAIDAWREQFRAFAPDLDVVGSVSYTHLTLPTIYSV